MKMLKISGKEYTLKIDFLAVKKVRARVKRSNEQGFDIMNLINFAPGEVDTDLLSELSSDSILLLEIIYTLLQDQLEKNKISEEEFLKNLSSEEVEKITDVLLEEIIDFFPPAKSQVLRKLYNAVKSVQMQAAKELQTILTDPATDMKIKKEIHGILRDAAQGSSE